MKPRLIDFFCKAGGATRGYQQAGFHVTGVDIEPQPNYCGDEFIQGDALAYMADADFMSRFVAAAASPPCQAHSSMKHMWNAKEHTDLVGPTRDLLTLSGLPWLIENVVGAPLIDPITLCGTAFGLGTQTAELRRHRLFETSWVIPMVPPCGHGMKPRVIGVYGGHGRDRRRTVNTQDFPTSDRREAMGIDWMTGAELSQAIPPAYTRWLGEQLLDHMALSAVPA